MRKKIYQALDTHTIIVSLVYNSMLNHNISRASELGDKRLFFLTFLLVQQPKPEPICRTAGPEGPSSHQLTDQAVYSKAQLEGLCFTRSGPLCRNVAWHWRGTSSVTGWMVWVGGEITHMQVGGLWSYQSEGSDGALRRFNGQLSQLASSIRAGANVMWMTVHQ